MDAITFAVQLLNGVQYGLVLFLVASGLTLVFGILGVINLAHGAFYMLGAYIAWYIASVTGSFALALIGAVAISFILGIALEEVFVKRMIGRDHLAQVLLSFGLILVIDETRQILFGKDVHSVAAPSWLQGSIQLTDVLSYPIYRLVLCIVCLLLAATIFFVIQKTRLGMVIRAGSEKSGYDARPWNSLRYCQSLRVCRRDRVGGIGGHSGCTSLDRIPRHGRQHVDPVFRGRGAGWHRLGHGCGDWCAFDRPDRYIR